jgi:hypothetical protein
MLPENTILGHLTILEIYEFYNMPVLFACQNRTGHLYLAVWIDETESEDVWLYVPLSFQRLMGLRQGELDLHTAFTQPEDDFALEVTVPKQEAEPAQAQPISVSQLDESWAPLPGEYLDLPDSLPRIVWENVDQRSVDRESTMTPPTGLSDVR